MPRVLILQFMDNDGPAYLGAWLARHGIASDLRVATLGHGFPDRIDGYAALALLGGAMSANDDLPFLCTAQQLIEQAMRRNTPVLGHCLGGQLMARTLGARVVASPAPEVGWHALQHLDSPIGREWLGPGPEHDVFHWHYEAFDVPSGAQRLAASDACPNQAFAIGPHLAMQFHVEVDAAKVGAWLSERDTLYDDAQRVHATVHGRDRIRHDTGRCLTAQMKLADRIYERWSRFAGLFPQ
ncbi:MAG TPA: type 1 glutamine amidotransferase [Burkholderiaceae bacterium]|nr:type 1 glutamine amidotransferase [Burkholderiaceae bacterium]